MASEYEVALTLPATSAYLRIARLAVVSMAADAGLSYEEIDDLRIAVDELWHALADVGDATAPLHLDIRRRRGSVVVEGRRQVAPPAAAGLTELARRQLDAAVDRYELHGVRPEMDAGHGERRFTLEKTASRPHSR